MLPRAVAPIAAAFGLLGTALFFVPASISLGWWVLPFGFGIGQIAIGVFVMRERKVRA
jgi:hypothetical protein